MRRKTVSRHVRQVSLPVVGYGRAASCCRRQRKTEDGSERDCQVDRTALGDRSHPIGGREVALDLLARSGGVVQPDQHVSRPSRTLNSAACRRALLVHDGYVRQVPIAAGVVEAIADDELRADAKAHVADVERHPLDALLDKQRRDLE